MFIDNKYSDCFNKLDAFFMQKEHKSGYIVIFGMNPSAKIEIAYFHDRKIPIGAVVDNNREKQGNFYCGEIIRDPEEVMCALPENAVIIVSSKNYKASITKDIINYNDKYVDKIWYANLFDELEAAPMLTDKNSLPRAYLEDIQKENFNMLSWILDVCRDNHLRCYLSYGTLLGAVRHNGFIPWDDDVDVSLPLPDYIKLHQIMERQDQYYFESMLAENSETVALSTIAKIKSKKIIVEDYNFPIKYEDYLAVDIWPLGGYPDDEEESKSYYQELQHLADEWKEYVVIPYGTKWFKKNKYRELTQKLLSAMARYDYETSNFVGEVYCGYLDHIRHDVSRRGVEKYNYEKAVTVSFENKEIRVPQGYDEILCSKYGNWKIPPEDGAKRIHGYCNSAYFISDNYFDRDTLYWDKFYRCVSDLNEPSLFAKTCISYMKPGETIVELGCGNGRDSIYFYNQKMIVTAIDASQAAINSLEAYGNKDNIDFICADFVSWIDRYKEKFDHCYSRFTIHAINEVQENILLHNVHYALKRNGLFYIETRSINDELYGLGECAGHNAYKFEGHFRRFIVMDELIKNLLDTEFEIVYSAEERGFAPFENDDPPIIRIIAKKL